MNITRQSAGVLVAEMRTGRLRCVEVMEAFADRIERYNSRVNAIIQLDLVKALDAAAVADKARDAGRARRRGRRRLPHLLLRPRRGPAHLAVPLQGHAEARARGLPPPVAAHLQGRERGALLHRVPRQVLARAQGGAAPC